MYSLNELQLDHYSKDTPSSSLCLRPTLRRLLHPRRIPLLSARSPTRSPSAVLLLVLLLVFPEFAGEQGTGLFVLDGFFGFDLVAVEGVRG